MKTILIVDNHPSSSLLMEEALQGKYRVLKAKDREDALFLSRTQSPIDGLVVDYDLPTTTGPQLILELRDLLQKDELPALLFTGMPLTNAVRLLAQKANILLQNKPRPWVADDFVAAVWYLLEKMDH